MDTRLSQWMTATGWSDDRLAEKVGVGRPHITRIRRGDRYPSPELAIELERVTGIPRALLVFDRERAA